MTETDELKSFETLVETHVEARLSRGEPAYISAVGIALGSDLQRLKAVSGLSLRDFITERMADTYRLIEVKPNTTGIWRANEPYDGAEIDPPERKPPKVRIPRYDQAFWHAFANPLTTGRRFYDQDAKEVRTADVAATARWIEIDPRYIRAVGEEYDAAAIASRVASWLQEANLEPADFVPRRTLKPEASSVQNSLLDLLISSLDSRQLRSVNISLDVVATLLKKSV